jgi:hypothetical protein
MPRIVLIAAVFGACMLADPRLVQAAEGPWCAFITLGTGGNYEDCRYRTFEECQPNVIAGNRGFCNHNPRWAGWYAPASEPRIRYKRHARKH